MRFLCFVTNIFSKIFTIPKNIGDGIENILDRREAIVLKIIANF
jgi:hypothetical protein